MKVLHLLAGGETGGIENLCREYVNNSSNENVVMILWGWNGTVTNLMREDGNKVIELGLSKYNCLFKFFWLYKFCKREKIDAIIVHHEAPVAYMFAAFMKKVKKEIIYLTYAHANAVDMVREKKKQGLTIRKMIMKKALRESDCTIAISESVKNSLVSYFDLNEKDISIIYNGVDINRFSRKEGKINHITQLIYVGRLIEEKGVQNTLYTLSKLPVELEYNFKIVGDGIYRQQLAQLANDLGLDSKVEFLGNRTGIEHILNESDIFIHVPNWEEGFGITIVEAMATGLVCVCGDSGAVQEIIEENISGYIVERDEKNDFSKLLENVIRKMKCQSLEEMRLNAQKRAQMFSIDTYASKVDTLLATIKLRK